VLLQVLLPYLEDPGDKAVCTIAGISQQCRTDVKAFIAGNVTKFLERALAKRQKDWEKVSVAKESLQEPRAVSCAALQSSSCEQYMHPGAQQNPHEWSIQWDSLGSLLHATRLTVSLEWEMLCCYAEPANWPAGLGLPHGRAGSYGTARCSSNSPTVHAGSLGLC